MAKIGPYLKSVAKSGKVWLGALAGVLAVLSQANLPDPYNSYVTTALLILGALGIHKARRDITQPDTPVGETGDAV